MVTDQHGETAVPTTDAVLDTHCPRCRAKPGSVCVGTISGRPMRAAHWQRISLARRRRDEISQ